VKDSSPTLLFEAAAFSGRSQFSGACTTTPAPVRSVATPSAAESWSSPARASKSAEEQEIQHMHSADCVLHCDGLARDRCRSPESIPSCDGKAFGSRSGIPLRGLPMRLRTLRQWSDLSTSIAWRQPINDSSSCFLSRHQSAAQKMDCAAEFKIISAF
jgi:hypothetical protein